MSSAPSTEHSESDVQRVQRQQGGRRRRQRRQAWDSGGDRQAPPPPRFPLRAGPVTRGTDPRCRTPENSASCPRIKAINRRKAVMEQKNANGAVSNLSRGCGWWQGWKGRRARVMAVQLVSRGASWSMICHHQQSRFERHIASAARSAGVLWRRSGGAEGSRRSMFSGSERLGASTRAAGRRPSRQQRLSQRAGRARGRATLLRRVCVPGRAGGCTIRWCSRGGPSLVDDGGGCA
jgi:hypothetical protein